MKLFFSTFFSNLFRTFWGKNLFLHALAIVLTYFLVMSGFDWWYFLATRNPILQVALFPALIIGGLLPILLLVVAFCIGLFQKNFRIKLIFYALAQAVLLGSLVSSVYKVFTGRVQPDLTQVLVDSSRQFQFGFLKHGIFWGWPSSHTIIAFAMAMTLVYLFPDNKTIRWCAILYAFYIGIGVSTNIHWFSEFVAGAIMGVVIGVVVGRCFVDIIEGSKVPVID